MNEPAHGALVDLSRLFKQYQYSHQSPGERDGPPPICTIEFRQQGCTLDAVEVKRWVKSLFALVRLAEKRAKQTTDYVNVPLRNNAYASPVEHEMAKYPSAPLPIEAFCSEKNLDLEREEIDYREARVDRYANIEQMYFATTEE